VTRWRVDLEYDGTPYQGWQVQPDAVTVQGVAERALEKFLGHPARISSAGRTDSGVHAQQQVASFKTHRDRSPEQVLEGLNRWLPDAIVVREAVVVPDAFHPRHTPHVKMYRYRILTSVPRSPLRHQRCWHLGRPLKVHSMALAAETLVGTHDYSSFRASRCTAASAVRSVERIQVGQVGDEVHVEVQGNGFLQHMVRIFVGSLIDVGVERKKPSWIAEVLAARDRRLAGRTAPAHGLELVSVSYLEERRP
jgi:tRNA pseudouridine38-40 synthase